LWNDHKHKESQKDFALAVKDHKLSGLLFRLRKIHGVDHQYGVSTDQIDALWRESGDMLVKCLFDKGETFDFDIEEVALEGA
jgi:hypothetical protein